MDCESPGCWLGPPIALRLALQARAQQSYAGRQASPALHAILTQLGLLSQSKYYIEVENSHSETPQPDGIGIQQSHGGDQNGNDEIRDCIEECWRALESDGNNDGMVEVLEELFRSFAGPAVDYASLVRTLMSPS